MQSPNPHKLLDRDRGMAPWQRSELIQRETFGGWICMLQEQLRAASYLLFKPYMEPSGKVGSAVISAQVSLEEPCNSGVSLKTPH